MISMVYVKKIKSRFMLTSLLLCMGTFSHAAAILPPFTITAMTKMPVNVPNNSILTVQYKVTNNTAQTITLNMNPITGVTQNTTGNSCAKPFTLSSNTSCILALNIDGATLAQVPEVVTRGPVICTRDENCSEPISADSLNITVIQPTATLDISANTF